MPDLIHVALRLNNFHRVLDQEVFFDNAWDSLNYAYNLNFEHFEHLPFCLPGTEQRNA